MAAVRPITKNQLDPLLLDNSVHYGILMGGPKAIEWSGVGESSVGHILIPRRSLAEFTRIQVGRRNDMAEALDSGADHLHKDWPKNPARIVSKSPRECIRDVFEVFGRNGFIYPASLIGVDFDEAVRLFNSVLPNSTAISPLVDVIQHFNGFVPDNAEQDRLRTELHAGAEISFNYLHEYIRSIKGEMELAKGTGKGKRGLDPVDKEYFWELREPLPEEIPALATLAMGKEIARSLNEPKVVDNTVSDLLKAMVEQNALLREQISNASRKSAQVTEPAVARR